MAISDDDLARLGRCVELACAALDAGDEPFGSILVSGDGHTLFEDHNRVSGGDATRHPEFAIAQWAVINLTQWLAEWDAPPPPVAALPITTVAPRVTADGPVPEFAEVMKSLYEKKFRS